MKKLLLSLAVIAFAFTANAQDGKFNVGANVGFPTGVTLFGAEANYLFDVADEFQVGPSVSYYHASVSGGGSFGFLPIAAAGRYKVSDEFTLGADLGYVTTVSLPVNGGEFYWRPMVGYNITDSIMIQASFSNMQGNSFAAGVMFGL